MTVPFSDAVARSVPVELIARNERGALCAWITLATVRERVENRRTSPHCCREVGDGAVAAVWVESGDVGDGTGDG
jgi:hypothetical protein